VESSTAQNEPPDPAQWMLISWDRG
jgi:hypothetical protein